MQGEEVPFYLLWKNIDLKRITLEFEGFRRIVKLFNVGVFERTRKGAIVNADNLKTEGYLGGLLSTIVSKNAEASGTFEVKLDLVDGTVRELAERRQIYSVRAELDACPKLITLPTNDRTPIVRVKLRGRATATISIVDAPPGLRLRVPREVARAYQLYADSVRSGLTDLKNEFPKYKSLLSKMLSEKLSKSISAYLRELNRELQKAKNDEEFMQSFSYVFVMAIAEQPSLRNALLVPLLEYLESSAAGKAFLESPFSGILVPPGGGRLKCLLVIHDLLRHSCGEPILIDTVVKSREERFVPLREIIRFERE